MAETVTMEEDVVFEKTSSYCWVNIAAGGTRVGKARLRRGATCLVIYSINIFPKFQGNGYARSVLEFAQRKYKVIVADRVRDTAKGFWIKMGFNAVGNGNYVWGRGR